MTLDAPALRAECNLLAAEHLLMEGRRAGEMSSKTQIRVSKVLHSTEPQDIHLTPLQPEMSMCFHRDARATDLGRLLQDVGCVGEVL